MTKTTNLLVTSAIIVAFAMLTTSALADAAIFIKVEEAPPGDSTLPGDPGGPENPTYGKWFVADSFSFGVENDRNKGEQQGEKGGTEDLNIGIGELQEVNISKSLDRTSAYLAQSAINGNSVGTAEICFVEVAGGSADAPVCYLHYKLDRVFVKSWNTDGGADDIPTEEVAFYYNKIAFAYVHTPDGPIFERGGAMTWDNVTNEPWTEVIDTIWDFLGLGNTR